MKYHLLLFALGLAIGLFISFTYYSNSVETQLSKWEAAAPRNLEAKVKVTQKVFDQKADSFQKQNVSLQADLKATKKDLATAKEKVYSLHLTLFELLDKRFEDSNSNLKAVDASCDTIVHHVAYLMQTSLEKDSLYEKAIANLEEQSKNWDSTLAVKDHQYREIKAAFMESVKGQEGLIQQHKLLEKRVRVQKLKGKLLSGAVLVITGAAATIFLQR